MHDQGEPYLSLLQVNSQPPGLVATPPSWPGVSCSGVLGRAGLGKAWDGADVVDTAGTVGTGDRGAGRPGETLVEARRPNAGDDSAALLKVLRQDRDALETRVQPVGGEEAPRGNTCRPERRPLSYTWVRWNIARRESAAAVAELKRTVERIRQRHPEMKTILLSLPLPRAPNRRRGGANRNFVRWFNAEAQRYAREVRQLCRGGVLGPRIFYIDHGFLTLPPWRFLAADGLHASFEAVAVLAQHFKERLRYHRPRWASAPRLTEETDNHDQASPPAGLPPCSPCPPCLPCPQRPPRPTPSRAPPVPERRYMTRLATKAAWQPTREAEN
ncbi:hypothetical protein HPB48_001049 [Haemaphysalis longicornis]|uniref:Uncharacterized protein n=1 Tax=Haemaphysalis longicornis TaxID=44386 RepID=A0A9J6GV45_HAELO|nr:hypothetical protein HPB48_001049 [Haemaphysalis longicornis]